MCIIEKMKDFLKEKISYYKLLLTFLVTGLYGTIGWCSSKDFNIAGSMQIAIKAAFVVIVILMGIAFYKIKIYTNQLKEED